MATEISIEYVFDQQIRKLNVPLGSTIQDVVGVNDQSVGVFGKLRTLDYTLQDGDRIEIYHPLLIDPKDARRARAKSFKK